MNHPGIDHPIEPLKTPQAESAPLARSQTDRKGGAAAAPPVHRMSLLRRLRYLFVHTPLAWRFVAIEQSSLQQVWQRLLGPMVMLSALLSLLGWGIARSGGIGYAMGWAGAMGAALLLAVLLSLGVWVLSRVVFALAPSFAQGGRASRRRSFQLMAHSAVPVLLSAFVAFVPGAVWLYLVGFAWMLWLMWQGLPTMLHVMPNKQRVFFWTLAAACLLWGLLTQFVMSTVLPGPLPLQSSDTLSQDVQAPLASASAAQVASESLAGDSNEAPTSGDQADGLGAAQDPLAASSESESMHAHLEPLDPSMLALSNKLAAALPNALQGLSRQGVSEQTIAVDGALGVLVNAAYEGGQKEIALNLIYVGPDPKSEVPGAWGNATVSRESEERIEKVYAEGLRHVSETEWKDGSAASLKLMLANGLLLDLDGQGVSLAQLKAALSELKVDELEQIDI